MAAIAFGFVEALATLKFKSNSFRTAELINDLCLHASTINERITDRHTITLTTKKDFSDFDFSIDLNIEFFDVELVAFLDAVLFAACFDYCVGHGRSGKLV